MTSALSDMEKHQFTNTKMALVFLFISCLLSISRAVTSSKIGINYGRLGNNLPCPSRSIEILQAMKAGRVKIYDADNEILHLLSGTKLEVTIMVTNEEIIDIASNQDRADRWVHDHVLAHYPDTMIRFILVGNEILSYTSTDQDRLIIRNLVPAMRRIKNSLKAQGINNIKVGTPLAMDMMESTFPPSCGRFKPELLEVIAPLLKFLSGTNSFFFIDVYPYFPWAQNPTSINLDFALLQGENRTYTDPDTGLTYTNLLDQMLDSVVFAMARLGYNDVRLAIAETGWPHGGDLNEHGANTQNAATYNRNLIRKMTAVPPKGTPARPAMVIPTYIFSLYDENQKNGPGTERHWGLLYPDGCPVYQVDLTGKSMRPAYQL